MMLSLVQFSGFSISSSFCCEGIAQDVTAFDVKHLKQLVQNISEKISPLLKQSSLLVFTSVHFQSVFLDYFFVLLHSFMHLFNFPP